ncbi:hypothetical protein L2D00_00170 [Hyphomonadaceae bacterium BL14]|nr:hypothetical protein L2D00_00170 [Hyphomonadaceae bacterium BL14]
MSRALNRGVKAFVLAAAVELTGAPAFAQSAPFYGEHLSGPFGLFTEAGERICTIELMSQYNQLRENFVLNASDCPEPFASAQRWGLERGMGTGRQQIAFWSGGFRPAWRGAVPGRDAAFWIGEASTGERFVLLPESEGPLRWLRGEPQAQRQADIEASRIRPGDLLGVYQVSPRNGYPRRCYLTLFRGPNGGGRITVEGEDCGPFSRADRFRYQQGSLLVGDRQGQPVWSGSVRQQSGTIRIVGSSREAGQWEINRQGASLPPPGAGLDMAALAGRWRFEEVGHGACDLSLSADGGVRPAFACDDPGQLFARWRLEGDLIILSNASHLNPTDLWRGRVVELNRVEGRGADGLVGLSPRRIERSRLVR